MELRHLRYFVVVAEELNFCRAAERLHIAQPPLSVQIRNLEEELGVELFFRVKRRLKLSPAGQLLFSEGRRLLKEAEALAGRVRRTASGETGRLAVGFISTATYDLLPAALALYRARYPKIQLALEDISSADQIVALRENRIDVGLLRPPIPELAVTSETILEERVMIALPVDHPLAHKSSLRLHDFAREPFLLCSSTNEPTLYELYMRLFEQAGFQPAIVQEATHIQTQVGLVAAGVAVCLVPSSVTALQRPGVVYRTIAEPAVTVPQAAAWRTDDLSMHVRLFVDVVREAAANLRLNNLPRQIKHPRIERGGGLDGFPDHAELAA